MSKPVISEDFTIDDIHKIREYHYETTKNMTKKERVKEINDKAKRFEEEYKSRKVVSY